MNRSQDAALGTGHLVALATGGVIGLGVMSMPGIGIGIIGTGLWIAALVGLGFSVIALVPQLLLNSSGEYRCNLVCSSLHGLVAKASSKPHATPAAAWFAFRRMPHCPAFGVGLSYASSTRV